MSEKVREFWIIDKDIGDGIGLVKGTMLALSIKPEGVTYDKHKEYFIHTIDKQAYDRLAEINKVLTEALEMYAMTNETFPEYGDVAREAIAKAKEMGK
jgi:hypothetical protein